MNVFVPTLTYVNEVCVIVLIPLTLPFFVDACMFVICINYFFLLYCRDDIPVKSPDDATSQALSQERKETEK